jgi:hypothetical protein
VLYGASHRAGQLGKTSPVRALNNNNNNDNINNNNNNNKHAYAGIQ